MNLEVIEQLKTEQAELNARGEKVVKGAFKTLFATHPELIAIKWRQFAPHFNDGEACVFGIRGVYFSTEPDAWFNSYGTFEDTYDKVVSEAVAKLVPVLEAFEEMLEDDFITQCFETAFGNDCEVVATPDKFVAEYTEHD